MILRTHRRFEAGMTLAEVTISGAIMALMTALLFTSITMIQHSFVASQYHATRQLEQARLLDYVSRDLRRAFSADQGSYKGYPGIRMVVPDYYQPRSSSAPPLRDGADVDAFDRPWPPRLESSTIIYGPSTATNQPTLTVWYYKNSADNAVYRTSIRGTEVTNARIVKDVQDFVVAYPPTGTKQSVQIKITFQSKYRFSMVNDPTVREGTAAFAKTLLRNKR